MTTLNCFRIVRLSLDLQKEFELPELICASPDGLPFIEGQVFYHWMTDDNVCELTHTHNYLRAILPFLTFLWNGSPSLVYTAPAEEIRARVREYLRKAGVCGPPTSRRQLHSQTDQNYHSYLGAPVPDSLKTILPLCKVEGVVHRHRSNGMEHSPNTKA